MITALDLHAGMTIVQPMPDGRLSLREVRDVDRVTLGARDWVVATVVEGPARFRLYYPAGHRVTTLPNHTDTVDRNGRHAWAVTRRGFVCLQSLPCFERVYPTMARLQEHLDRHQVYGGAAACSAVALQRQAVRSGF